MAHQLPHNNYLWIARKKAGLGQKSVARLLGYKSISPVSEYETGRLLPSLRTALKLAALYNVPVAQLYRPLYREVEAEIEGRRKKSTPAPQLRILPQQSITL